MGIEFMSFHELSSTGSIHFSTLILISLAHIFPPPLLLLDSWSSVWYLVVDLCIWFHQLLDGGSVMIVGVFNNLITIQAPFPLLLGVLAEFIFVDSENFPGTRFLANPNCPPNQSRHLFNFFTPQSHPQPAQPDPSFSHSPPPVKFILNDVLLFLMVCMCVCQCVAMCM